MRAPRTAIVEVAIADLTRDGGWAEAVAGCDYVLHVASPFPATSPADEDELIVPARDGALRVLAAAREAGVKRVVMTSSFAAVGYGRPTTRPFTEDDWSDLYGRDVTPYVKSKTLAERAAWDFAATTGLELAVINPTAIFGPVLGDSRSSSIELIDALLTRRLPAVPKLAFGVVDVRDVADLHIRAMTHPAAAGERFLATAGTITLPVIARLLRRSDARVPTRVVPDWAVRAAAPFSAHAREAARQLGKTPVASSEKARRVLGWTPRPPQQAIAAAAASLVA
jgi:dihydroflavonol-4-reductase